MWYGSNAGTETWPAKKIARYIYQVVLCDQGGTVDPFLLVGEVW